MNDNSSLLCECGNPKAKRARGCERCLEIDRGRCSLDGTRERTLTRLARLDWATAQEVFLALECSGNVDARQYGAMLRRLVREGFVETRGQSTATEYRLVQRKRRAA